MAQPSRPAGGGEGVDPPPRRFHEIVERDGKTVPVASTVGLAAKLLVAAPLWATLVLPLTVAYQAGKALLGKSGDQEDDGANDARSTTTILEAKDVIPRPDRKHDVVVLGATGFTGGLAVRHLARTYGAPTSPGGVQWAVAGRSRSKLEALLKEVADETGIPSLPDQVAIVICDTSDPSTLPALVKDTRSVATTAGPFSLYGEPVVAACAAYGTHYADITGETSFVKASKAKHQARAEASGARILSLCGNDCVPWDLSYNLLADACAERGETLEKVSFGNEFSSSASGGTLKTMCLGLSGRLAPIAPSEETMLRRRGTGPWEEHPEPLENAIRFGITPGIEKPWLLGTPDRGEDDSRLVEGPFVMSGVNYEAVGWSHALRGDPKCSYNEQCLFPDFGTALDSVVGLALFVTALGNPLTAWLLEKFLLPPPGAGPTQTAMEEEYFLALTGTATTREGSLLQSLLYYDKDPGYLETARMVVECALCLALDEKAISEERGIVGGGGFFAPGFLLRKRLLDRLVGTGCHYEFRVVQEAGATTTTTTSAAAPTAAL